MNETFDLDAYLDRIHYTGERNPTLATLSGLLHAHTAHIPFENFDVLMGRPIQIDLDSLQQKLVQNRRGGYCFEQTTLFAAALEQLGFHPVPHTARVTLFFPRAQAPRTHMFLSVPLPEGTFVADPGFGGGAARFPVRVPDSDGPVQEDEGETHMLVRDDRFFVLRAPGKDGVVDAWSSTLEPESPVDFILGNHYTATYPESSFVNRLMLAAYSSDAHVTAMNRDVTIRRQGQVQTFRLADRSALRELVAEHLGFDLPEIEQLRVPSIPEWE